MKLFFTFCFMTSIVLGQCDDNFLKNIKKQFVLTSELKDKGLLLEKELPYSCEDKSVEGLLTYYYQNNNLQLIVHSYSQGHETISKSYYVQYGMLFFYFSEEYTNNDTPVYDEQTGSLVNTLENWSTSETKIYFDNQNAIKCLVKQFNNSDVTIYHKEKYENVSDHFEDSETTCDPFEVKKHFIRVY